MAKVLYTRVSSVSQNTDRQLQDANSYDKVYEDKCSGKNTNRPALQEMLNYIRSDDQVYFHELSRASRSMADLLTLLDKILGKGCEVFFLKENLHFTPNKEDPVSKLFFHILSSFSEFERNCIKIRQREGIEIARSRGVYKGGHKKLTPEQAEELRELHTCNPKAWNVPALMKRFGLSSRGSVYNYLKAT